MKIYEIWTNTIDDEIIIFNWQDDFYYMSEKNKFIIVKKTGNNYTFSLLELIRYDWEYQKDLTETQFKRKIREKNKKI